MHIAHLMASPFVGGPERQVLGLARAMRPHRSTFLSYAERGLARPFLETARKDGFDAIELQSNFPRVFSCIDEVARLLKRVKADALLTSCYKPDLIGWRAARKVGIPVVAIAHGWTGATLKVRVYEFLDAVAMRFMDAVACVSESMARRVRRMGVPGCKVKVIRNALDFGPFAEIDPSARAIVSGFFAKPPKHIIGAAGRFSPEKGFDVLADAAALLCKQRDDVGFLVFGRGPLEDDIKQRIARTGLEGRFILGGFRTDVERLLPGLDLFASPSRTEGLPVAVLEAQAAGVPVVATSVGGTPEAVAEGRTGFLVPTERPDLLASSLSMLLDDDARRLTMGGEARRRVKEEFGFAAQASAYERLLGGLLRRGPSPSHPVTQSPSHPLTKSSEGGPLHDR